MKKYFNKSIFKDKSFIKMICFTIVLLLVLVLGNTFGYVSADSLGTDLGISGATEFMSYSGYQNSSLYDSSYPSYYSNYFISSPLGGEDTAQIFDNITSFVSSNVHSEFPNYAILLSNNYSNSMSFSVVFWDSDSVFAYTGTGIMISANGDGHKVESFNFDYNNGSPTLTYHNLFNIQRFDNDYDGYYFYAIGGGNMQIQGRIGFANCSIYAYDNINASWNGNNYEFWNSCWYLWHKLNGVSGYENYYHDINYYTADGLQGGSGSSGGVGPQNYMYADSADWYLSNFNGNIWSNYRTVSTVFTSNLNNYITDSLVLNDPNTDSNYTIDFDFQIYIDFYYSYCIGTSSSNPEVVIPDTTLNGSFVSLSIDDVNGTGEGYNDLFLWSCTYDAPASMGNYLSGMHIDASTFADNGYLQDFPLSALFAYMEPTNSYVVNPNGVKSNISITLQQLMYLIDNGYIGRNNNLVSEKFEIRNFRLTCTANIEYGDFYDSVFHDTYESGKYSETFDLLTGDSYIGDDSMLTNYNPYIENDSNDYSSLPSTSTYPSSSSNTISTSNGNVTQTVNVTNSGAQYIPSLISNLIPTSLGDTGTGLVSTFSTMAQTNGFISVMASTVPAIPSTVWTYLTNYLGISLYLLACAFVLRLILDLL